MLEQCNLRGFDRDKLTELCELLGDNATDVGDLFRKRIAPSPAAMTLFRQVAAEYLRLHPTFVARNSWGERWRMARAAVAFVRGKGAVPRLHTGLPETTFEALERSLGHLDDAVQRPLTRFFETHAMSLQYALVGRSRLDADSEFPCAGVVVPGWHVAAATVLHRSYADACRRHRHRDDHGPGTRLRAAGFLESSLADHICFTPAECASKNLRAWYSR